MPVDANIKKQLAQFGRTVALLFNRSMMYQPNHPFVKQSIDLFYDGAVRLLEHISPLVFILNREEFFVDEEPLDQRINVGRLVVLFKNNGIQSISIDPDLEKREIQAFLEAFGNISKYHGAEGFRKAIFSRGVTSIKVNHVRYRKVTEDDEVISKDTLREVTPQLMDSEEEAKARKMFMDTLLESVLTEEFAKTLNIESLMANPGAVSDNMIQADLAHASPADKGSGDGGDGEAVAGDSGPGDIGGADASGTDGESNTVVTPERGSGGGSASGGDSGTASSGGSGESGPGNLLVQQLDVMRMEVEKHLDGQGDLEIADLANAVFDMKKQLLEGLEAQKALGVAYENEEAILENANELTDHVILQLVKDEYQKGNVTPARMAQILRRLVPESADLKRLLPKLKAALLEEGMSHTHYLELVQELSRELQSESLASILQESGEEIGVDGDQLIAEFKQNPEQAAQLIYLASEIRKGSGNDDALVEILSDYVEQVGSQMAIDESQNDDPAHLKQVVGSIESNIVRQLGKMDVDDGIIAKLEDRLNSRMEAVMDQMRAEWIKSRHAAGAGSKKAHKTLSVLQTLEQSVSDQDELGGILRTIRVKVEAGEIDENDYKRIQDEISRQKQLIKEKEANRVMPAGVIKAGAMAYILEKEIARANRYDYGFSALAFSIVQVKPRGKIKAGTIDSDIILEAVLAVLANTFREVDIVGQLGKNTILAALPMIDREGSKKALNRVMKVLQESPIDVNGALIDFKFAGIAITFDGQQTPDLKSFMRVMSGRLQDMASRLKNIQAFM